MKTSEQNLLWSRFGMQHKEPGEKRLTIRTMKTLDPINLHNTLASSLSLQVQLFREVVQTPVSPDGLFV